MEKCRDTIRKMIRLIIMLSICIILLEANSLDDFRNSLVMYIPILDGKREIISNIFIGIWGGSALALLNELIEYQHLKKNMKSQILRICIKWNQDIKYKDLFPINNAEHFNFVGKEISRYWEEIERIYFDYLPFFRAGLYFYLIRYLYSYCKVYKDYIEERERYQKEIKYLNKQINYNQKQINNMCTREEKKSIMNIINFYKARLNNYQDELLKHDIKKVIKEANDKRDKLNEKLRYIDVLKMKEDYDGIYKKDEMDELEQMI